MAIFVKNLDLMFEIMFERVLNIQTENANNPRKVAHAKITTKTSAMKVVFMTLVRRSENGKNHLDRK